MITREELIRIGRFNKPHGVKGELSFTFTDDVFDRTECSYIVCEIDGIFVPFFIEEYRFKSDTTAFTVIDSEKGVLGKIVSIDDYTENVLFEVEYNGRLLLIPAVDEFVCEIDEDNRKLYLNIPDGLLDL